jgi:ketosteroid isomerase-like protein
MNKTIRLTNLAAAVILSCLAMAGCKKSGATTSASMEELGQMNRDFAKALIAKDAAAAAMLYDANASLLPPNEPIVTGRDKIQEYWQGLIDAGLVDVSVQTIDAESDGDLGYEIGTFELKLAGENGETITDGGKYTEILKRDATGKWISIYGMWSSNEPAPPQ